MKGKLVFGYSILAIFAILLASCASAQSQVTAPGAGVAPVSSPAATATSDTSEGSAAPALSPSAIQYVLVPANSEASFAVREQLAGRDLPSDAIGTTKNITGTVTINPDGTIDPAHSQFTVEVGTLQTDVSMRDNFVRRNILHTNQYPEAVFVPKSVSGITPDIHQTGQVSFKMTGDLTIQNVTKSVTWDVTGNITNGEATGTAVTSFTFEDFNLNQPRVPTVLSIVDKITLTIKVDLKRQGN